MGNLSTVGISVGGATLGACLGVKGCMKIGTDLGEVAAESTGSEDEVYIYYHKVRAGLIGAVAGGIAGGIGGASLGYEAGDILS